MKNMGWCDDVNSKYYNKQIKINKKINHEKLYRKDNVYDILVVLNYNLNPIIRGKGSAIFLHVAKKKYKKTQGCIALKKSELLYLISKIKKNTQIKIG
jgi:L,D-peptidoglycan transpeptidase YkuD (ErfK/YbiS/YcfS/YnhG family)